MGFQIVVGVPSLFIIPQIFLDGLLAGVSQRIVLRSASAVPGCLAGAGEGFLQMEHQGIEIDRDNRGGANGGELLRIIHPAGAEIPAGGGGGAQVAIDLGCRTIRVAFGGFDVVKPGLGARGVVIVPVAVEQRAVRHPHRPFVGAAGGQRVRSGHPVAILLLQLRLVGFQYLVAIVRRQQAHHKGEEGGLRTAEVIGAVAVGDMAPGVNFRGEVGDHILDFIPVTAFGKTQHGEIAVPVIDFAKTSSGDHVGLRQRQQRVPFFHLDGAAGQDRPQAIDMLTQGLPFGRHIGVIFFRQREVQLDEVAQVKAGLVFLHPVIGKDHQRIAVRDRVGEGFLIGKELRALDIIEQRAQQNIRRGGRRGFAVFRLDIQAHQGEQGAADRQAQGTGQSSGTMCISTRHGEFSLSLSTAGHDVWPSKNLRRISAAARVRGNILRENRGFTCQVF